MCDRRIWGDLDSGGLCCTNDKPHVPGPNTCRYVASECPDGTHDDRATQEDQ